MAEYVKELTVPNSAGTGTSTYQIKEDPAIHYVTCGTAAATAAKTVSMSGFKLETGSWVAIKFTVTNTAAVANLTMNVNSTGAKGIKYRNSNLPAAGTLTANRIYLFVYDGTYWQIVGDLDTDSNTYDRTSVQTRIYAGTAGVFNYSLVGLDSNQRMQSFTTTSGTATSKAFNTGAKFLYPPTIMYHSANATVTNGNVISNNVLYEQFPSLDLRYSCNITTSAGFAQYKPVYIECTLDSNGYWSITSTGLTQTFTTGKYYILLGCMYNTSIYQLALFAYNPMFYYDGTSLTGIFPQFNKTLTSSTVDSTPGSFMFQGNNLIGGTYDWVGVQVSSGTDKLQIMGSNGHLITRQDDSNDSSGDWSDWIQTMSAGDVSGEAGITVTPTTKDIGTGDDKYVVKDGVVIKHSNSITAQTSAVFKKITYDAQGHITGTANVVKGDIPALDYVPNTSTGVSAAINLLIVGTSTPSLNDYYVSQYAAGGTTTTSYHRRPLSALWTLFKSLITVTTTGAGNAITAASISDDGNNRKITFTKGLTFSLSNHTHDYSKVSFTRSLTSGTKIGTITIDGTATDLYCETNTNTDTKVDQVLSSANEKHPLLIAKSQTSVTTTTVNDTILRNNSIYVNPSTGALTATQIYGSGTENQSTAPTGGYHIYDCRSVTINPEHGHNAANFYFHQTGTPDTSKWWSILHMRGWTSGYSAWELAGPSHNSDQRTTPLYVRTSNGTTAWGSWRKIYDSSNKPTATELGFGTIVTHNEGDYVLKAGDTMTGSLTLYSASGDSPALRFQCGTLTDNLNDWLIKDSGGHLKIQSNTTSTDTYFDALTINSSTANITMKEDAVLHGKLAQYSTSRQTTANLTTKGDASLQMILSTSTMTSGKPAGDGYILNMDWDNTGKYQAQLFLPNSYSKVKPPQYRVQNASADWSDADCKWRNFITEDNYTDYTSRFGHVLDNSEDFASYPWHKIATTTITGNYTDHEATFLVQKTWSTYEQCVGILAVKIHTGSDYHFESGIFKWIFTGTGINTEDYVVVYTNGTNSCTVDIYVKITTRADGWRFNILSEGTRVFTAPMWDMIVTGSQHGIASLPAGTGHIVSSRWDAYIPLIGSTDVTGNIKITKTSGDTGYYASRSDTSITCWFGVASGGTNHGFYSNKINNWMFAANATNALVYHTLQNPSSETSYAISFGGNNTSAGVKERFVNNGLAYRTKEGTTSSAGVSTLILGNATGSGTAGNKSGRIRLYTTSTQYCDIIGYMSSTSYTMTIPPISGRATLQAKGTTSFYGLADGDGTQGWIRTTNYGFIPSAAGTMKSPHSSLGTANWVFNDAHVRDIYGAKLELGQAYTVDSSAIGGSIKMHGDGDEIMDTVTLKPADVPGGNNYNITVPMMNGTMSLIDTIATTSSTVPAASTVSNCTIDSAVKFLTIVLKVNGESDEHYTIQVPKIIGVHYFPITIGAGPTTGGGSCIVTSGFIQITSGSTTGKYNITAGRKTQTATMTSSGWSISSPSWTPLIVAVYGIK